MFRFIHSADWQLGAGFRPFGARAETLRVQRLATLRTALDLARERAVDAFLVAGDLFEDNLVADSLVETTLRLFADFPDVPVRILPGNHDPASGPASVWSRPQFRDGALPASVAVFRDPGAFALGTAALLASPLKQKVSSTDPSRCLVELAQQVPGDCVKIGLTHGALAIPGKHQPNDFPIAPDAATRAGLDYLGIGHWHNWQVYDGGRLVMPGTPEQDAFDQDHAGFVACVELDGPAARPRVEPIRVGRMRWMRWECDFSDWVAARSRLSGQICAWGEGAARRVCRVALRGSASGEDRAAALAWLRESFAATLHFEVDATALRPALSAGEFAALEQDHPILGQVFADLRQIEFLATNAAVIDPLPASGPAISLPETQALLAAARLSLAELGAGDFAAARGLLRDALGSAAVTVCA